MRNLHILIFQGIIVEIGNLRYFQIFIPAQDKNKIYKSDKKLCELASLSEIYKFSGSFICH